MQEGKYIMKKIKILAVMLFAVLLILGMTACSGKSESSEAEPEAPAAEEAEETEEPAEEEPEEEQASDGTVTLDVTGGGQIILTPAELSAFTDLDDDAMVTTAIGDTVMSGGSTLWAGSMLPLEMVLGSETYDLAKVAFTYELTGGADSEEALNTAGNAAKLVLNGEDYKVKVLWYSGGTGCFLFDCEELPETAPKFTKEDDAVIISF